MSTEAAFRREVDYRHTIATLPDIAISPSAVAPSPLDASSFKRAITSFALSGGMVAKALTLAKSRRAGQGLQGSDVVFDRGGPFLDAGRWPPNFTLLGHLWPFLAAMRAGIPYGLVGETLGEAGNPWSRYLLRSVLNGAEVVGAREEYSLTAMHKLGVRKAVTMLDNAFWVEPRATDRGRAVLSDNGIRDGEYLAVTCRPWGDMTPRYLNELAAGIAALVPSVFPVALIIPTCVNPSGGNPDDRGVGALLAQRLDDRMAAIPIEADLAPDELSWLLGNAALLIGTRLHSLILGLVGGGRVIGVSYYGNKTRGVLELLGLGEYVLEIDRFTSAEVVGMSARALRHQSSTRPRIEERRVEDDQILARAVISALER